MHIKALYMRGRRFPGFLIGSILQTAATFERKKEFPFIKGKKSIFLVPGAFCTSSVMNKLGEMIKSLGFNVFLPSDVPYYYGPLANTCQLGEAAKLFLRDAYSVMNRFGIDEFYVVGHSNGGLIPLVALEYDISGRYKNAFKGIITLATPFKGTDIAKLVLPVLPVARDILPGRDILNNIEEAKKKILLCIQSGSDFLVPPQFQYPDGVEPFTFEDFNHMDFIVGSETKIKKTADKIKEIIDGK